MVKSTNIEPKKLASYLLCTVFVTHLCNVHVTHSNPETVGVTLASALSSVLWRMKQHLWFVTLPVYLQARAVEVI